MREDFSASWKDKLPSMLVALAVQAGFFALLAFSFTVVTRAPPQEQEVIFLLPKPKPKPPPDPMVIDAQPRQPDAAAPPPAATSILPPSDNSNGITALPGYAQSPTGPALLQALGRAANCQPDAQGRISSLCTAVARPDPKIVALHPPDHVKKPDQWADEKARTDSPLTLPGGNPLGILLTALTNPSAFLDKRNYQPAPPPSRSKMTWAEAEYLKRYTSPQCPPGMGTDMERRQCAANAGALEGMRQQ